jgi:ribonucleotide reductase alpha subunit
MVGSGSFIVQCYTNYDAAKLNQQNVGTIESSNLCTEIIERSSPKGSAMCNLAPLALATFTSNGKYDLEKLHAVTKSVTYDLNRIIDVNYLKRADPTFAIVPSASACKS